MRDYKDWLIEMCADFEEEHGREPTQAEIDDEYGYRIDCVCGANEDR